MKAEDTPNPPRDMREDGLHVVMRFVALLRTARSYSIGNAAFTAQLETFLQVLLPLLEEHGQAQLMQLDGDLHLNGMRLPSHHQTVRFQDRLLQEFAMRRIAGVTFTEGIDLHEMEKFLRFFLTSEVHKGEELIAACADAGVLHALPTVHVERAARERAQAPELPMGLTAALDAYDEAIEGARTLLRGDALERGVELRHVKRLLQPLLEITLRGSSATVGLLDAVPHEPWWTHGMHVCLVAVGVGRRLGLDRRTLADLGVAALLHDAGQEWVAGSLRHSPQQWTGEERAAAARHTLEGVRRIAGSTTLNSTSLVAMRAALEHHALGTGALFPTTRRPAALTQVVAIADAYVTLLTRAEAGSVPATPSEALAAVLGPLGEVFAPALRLALVRTLGVHPPGQVVELDDGTLARALAPSEDPERPSIELLTAPGGALLPAGSRPVCELAPERHVVRALPIASWPDLDASSTKAA